MAQGKPVRGERLGKHWEVWEQGAGRVFQDQLSVITRFVLTQNRAFALQSLPVSSFSANASVLAGLSTMQ